MGSKHERRRKQCAFTSNTILSEDDMQSIDGRVSKFLYNSMGFLSGFVLGRGHEIRFSQSHANVGAVTETATIGSRVEVQDELRTDDAGEEYLHAALIMHLDSKRNASLPAPMCAGKSGLLPDGAPNKPASPVHQGSLDGEHPVEIVSQAERAGDAIALYLKRRAFHLKHSACSSEENLVVSTAILPCATATDAGTAIERAYDGLHRIQAILAYLHIVKRRVPGISQFLDEAKHTYEQALAHHATQHFEGAREFAWASQCLSHVAEIVISRTLRSDKSYPAMVPPPPEHPTSCAESSHMQRSLNEVESVLSRIHWLLDNGTPPLEDRTQVRKIASWGDAFYQQARRMYRSGSLEDACELVQAAKSAAHSAEHICRNWYVAPFNPREVTAEPSPHP
jgi:hypothetical protein